MYPCTPYTPSPSLPKMDMPNSAARFPIVHTKAQSSHSHFHFLRQNTHVTDSCQSSSPSCQSSHLSRALLMLCVRQSRKHSRCTFCPHWARHHTASFEQWISSQHITQSVIGFLLTLCG